MGAKIIMLNSKSALWFNTKQKAFSVGRRQVVIIAATTSTIGTIAERSELLTSVSDAA